MAPDMSRLFHQSSGSSMLPPNHGQPSSRALSHPFLPGTVVHESIRLPRPFTVVPGFC